MGRHQKLIATLLRFSVGLTHPLLMRRVGRDAFDWMLKPPAEPRPVRGPRFWLTLAAVVTLVLAAGALGAALLASHGHGAPATSVAVAAVYLAIVIYLTPFALAVMPPAEPRPVREPLFSRHLRLRIAAVVTLTLAAGALAATLLASQGSAAAAALVAASAVVLAIFVYLAAIVLTVIRQQRRTAN